LEKLKRVLNNILTPYIFIKRLNFIDINFHSRFLATARSYRYLITNQFTPFNSNYTFYKKDLDIEIMQKAIKVFEGVHNFEYFHKRGSETNSFIREIYNTKIITYKNYVIIRFVANGFLRSQIRMMTQFLMDISDKKLTIKNLENQLNKKEKHSTNLISPTGLYFERVYYEKNFNN